jgi:hypothetical protein
MAQHRSWNELGAVSKPDHSIIQLQYLTSGVFVLQAKLYQSSHSDQPVPVSQTIEPECRAGMSSQNNVDIRI